MQVHAYWLTQCKRRSRPAKLKSCPQAALQAADELHAPSRELVCLQIFPGENPTIAFWAKFPAIVLNEKRSEIVKSSVSKIIHY